MTQLQEALQESHNIISHIAGNPLTLSQCHKPLSNFQQWELQIMKITDPTCDLMWNVDVLHCIC